MNITLMVHSIISPAHEHYHHIKIVTIEYGQLLFFWA